MLCNYSIVYIQLHAFIFTHPTVPGSMLPPISNRVEATSAIIRWSRPEDPNGIIVSYNLELEPVMFVEDPFESMKRAQEDVLVCYQFLNRNPIISLTVFGVEANVSLSKLLFYH